LTYSANIDKELYFLFDLNIKNIADNDFVISKDFIGPKMQCKRAWFWRFRDAGDDINAS